MTTNAAHGGGPAGSALATEIARTRADLGETVQALAATAARNPRVRRNAVPVLAGSALVAGVIVLVARRRRG